METSKKTTPCATSVASQHAWRGGRVLIVGVGGLGCPAALQLAAGGVQTLGLLDFDTVEISNLHRQLLYRSADSGRSKVAVAAARLARLHPTVGVRPFEQRLTPANVVEIFRAFDFIIDASDGISTKYLVNDGAVLCGIPFSHAGIAGLQGQCMTVVPRQSACLRCLFPVPPAEGDVPSCREAGIIGPLCGIMGAVQATEALKYLQGIGTLLTNRLLTYDAGRERWRTVAVPRNPQCPLCGDQPTIRRIELAQTGLECR